MVLTYRLGLMPCRTRQIQRGNMFALAQDHRASKLFTQSPQSTHRYPGISLKNGYLHRQGTHSASG
jgi:hypothetical protein